MKASSPIFRMDEKLCEIEDTMQKLKMLKNTWVDTISNEAYTWEEIFAMFSILNDYITATHEGIKELRELTDAAHTEAERQAQEELKA